MRSLRSFLRGFCEVGHSYDFVTREKRYIGRLILWPPYWLEERYPDTLWNTKSIPLPLSVVLWLLKDDTR